MLTDQLTPALDSPAARDSSISAAPSEMNDLVFIIDSSSSSSIELDNPALADAPGRQPTTGPVPAELTIRLWKPHPGGAKTQSQKSKLTWRGQASIMRAS
jgi:hypothetical protein